MFLTIKLFDFSFMYNFFFLIIFGVNSLLLFNDLFIFLLGLV